MMNIILAYFMYTCSSLFLLQIVQDEIVTEINVRSHLFGLKLKPTITLTKQKILDGFTVLPMSVGNSLSCLVSESSGA